jgi:hypothetical protein
VVALVMALVLANRCATARNVRLRATSMRIAAILLLCLLCGASRSAGAQADTTHAAVVLRVSASAKEVRFNAKPVVRVHLLGSNLDSVRVIERRNLPDTVQPGVTYHDVYIAVEILGHLNTQCLLRQLGVAPVQPDSRWHDTCPRGSGTDTSQTRRP